MATSRCWCCGAPSTATICSDCHRDAQHDSGSADRVRRARMAPQVCLGCGRPTCSCPKRETATKTQRKEKTVDLAIVGMLSMVASMAPYDGNVPNLIVLRQNVGGRWYKIKGTLVDVDLVSGKVLFKGEEDDFPFTFDLDVITDIRVGRFFETVTVSLG